MNRILFNLVLISALAGASFAQDVESVVLVDVDSVTTWIEPLQDLPNSGDPTGWTATVYDTSQDDGKGDPDNGSTNWEVGQHGVGYGDGDDNTIIFDDNNTFGFYTRTDFTVEDASLVVGMRLEVDYDDGYILFINGIEVNRSSNAVGAATWDLLVLGHASSESGVLEAPISLDGSLSALVDGLNVMAVSVRNTNIGSSDLTFISRLTIDIPLGPAPSFTRDGAIDSAILMGSGSWTVDFGEDVENVSDGDFSLILVGDVSVGSGPTVAGGPASYTVSIGGVTGTVGSIALKFTSNDVVSTSSGLPAQSVSGAPYSTFPLSAANRWTILFLTITLTLAAAVVIRRKALKHTRALNI